jgi:hypothetical protein
MKIVFTRYVFCVLAISMFQGAAYAKEMCDSSYSAFSDRMPCYADTISWVEFYHSGDHKELFERHKGDFERFTRMRLRNDLSEFNQDVLSFDDALRTLNYPSIETKRRARVVCTVWLVGETYPVARHVECEMTGYGPYDGLQMDISQAVLGYGSSQDIVESTKDAIRIIIGDMASRFYEVKHVAEPIEPKSE